MFIMNEITKAKLSLNGSFIELEGSEDFVQKNLNEFKEKIFRGSVALPSPTPVNSNTKPPQKKAPAKVFVKNPEPVPFNAKEDASKSKPSLRKFIKDKNPQSNKEMLASIALYLKKYIGLQEFNEGHVSYAYLDLKIKRPAAFHQLFIDTKNQYRWIIPGDNGPDTWKLYQIGEDFVEGDLPRRQENEKK